MNMEQTGAGASRTESTERDDFTKAEARLDEIKTMNMGDMSDDDLENVMAERKALRTQKEEMMGSAQEEANAENQERSNAEKMATDAAEIAKAEAEVTAQAEKAKQKEERLQAEELQKAALLAEIKGENVIADQEAKAGLAAELDSMMDENRANYARSREVDAIVANNQLDNLKNAEPDTFGRIGYHTAESKMIDDAEREDRKRTSGNYHPSGGEEAIAELKSKLAEQKENSVVNTQNKYRLDYR